MQNWERNIYGAETPGARKAREALVRILRTHGSLDFAANMVLCEEHKRRGDFPADILPTPGHADVTYLMGLFLTENNLDAGVPPPQVLRDAYAALRRYGAAAADWRGQSGLGGDIKTFDAMGHYSRLRMEGDGLYNTDLYEGDEEDRIERIFFPLDDYFSSEYGFSARDAVCFGREIRRHISDGLSDGFDRAEEEHHFAAGLPLWKAGDRPDLFDLFDPQRAAKILTIQPEDFCRSRGIKDAGAFARYLEVLSCIMGEEGNLEGVQFQNILCAKPVIRLKDGYFLARHYFLTDEPGIPLEWHVRGEQKGGPVERMVALKKRYFVDRTFRILSGVLPADCIHRNLHYNAGGSDEEVELVAIYDNRVIIAETAAGITMGRTGPGGLPDRPPSPWENVEDARSNIARAISYIRSSRTAKFYRNGDEILAVKPGGLEFIPITVTRLYLGPGLSLMDGNGGAKGRGLLKEDVHPWTVYSHDLNMAASVLKEPAYLVHYIERRAKALRGVREPGILEPQLIVRYIANSTLDAPSVEKIAEVRPEDSVEMDHLATFGAGMQRYRMPDGLEKVLSDVQNRRRPGFLTVTNAMLDIGPKTKQNMADGIEREVKGTKPGDVGGFVLAFEELGFGIMYLTYNGIKDPEWEVRESVKEQKGEDPGVKRWVVIYRDVRNSEDLAPFFIDESGM